MTPASLRLLVVTFLALFFMTPQVHAEDGGQLQTRTIRSDRQGPLLRQNEIIDTLLREVNSGAYNVSRVELKLDTFGFLEVALIVFHKEKGGGNDRRIRMYYPQQQTPEQIGNDVASVLVSVKPIAYRLFSIDEKMTGRIVLLLFMYQLPPPLLVFYDRPPRAVFS